MKKQSLLLICLILILLPQSAKTEDQIYTDQDLKKLDYEHQTTTKIPQKYSEPVVIEYRDLLQRNQDRIKEQQQRQSQQRQIIIEKYQLDYQQQLIAREIIKEAAEKKATTLAAIVLLAIIVFIAWVSTLVSVLSNEFTRSNKLIWFLTITFMPIIGPIIYFFLQDKYKIMTYDKE